VRLARRKLATLELVLTGADSNAALPFSTLWNSTPGAAPAATPDSVTSPAGPAGTSTIAVVFGGTVTLSLKHSSASSQEASMQARMDSKSPRAQVTRNGWPHQVGHLQPAELLPMRTVSEHMRQVRPAPPNQCCDPHRPGPLVLFQRR
jgi:hypothetical protein